MVILQLQHIGHSYGTQTVLEDVSWELQAGEKIGLVGPNGAGKSTLLQIIVGELQPEKGSIVRPGSLGRVGYLAQDPVLNPEHTVWQEVLSAATELNRIEGELRRLEARMADPDVYANETELERALAAHARAQAAFERLDGYRYESRAREILHALGFTEGDFYLPTTALSGGQTKLVGLAKLLVREPKVVPETRVADSISVNGCCLTVVEVEGDTMAFEAGPETLARTNLGDLKVGSKVNLERALKVGDRLGGHFVSGHIDATGTLLERNDEGQWAFFWFEIPKPLSLKMASKGSIAVDGVSLTIVDSQPERFSVALIPYTLAVTTLGPLEVGGKVNLETDILAKYVQRLVEAKDWD